MCKKTVRGTAKECPTCRTDLAILVDYMSDLDSSLEKAEAKTRAGELGEAIWAYLQVLEVDPDNPEDKRDLEELVRQVRLAMGSSDRKKMEEATAALNDRLLNYAYLL